MSVFFSNWILTSIKHTFSRHFQLEKCETIYKLARMNLSRSYVKEVWILDRNNQIQLFW